MQNPLTSYSVRPFFPVNVNIPIAPTILLLSEWAVTSSWSPAGMNLRPSSFICRTSYWVLGIWQRQGQTFCLSSNNLLSDGNLTENQKNRSSKTQCLVNVVRNSSHSPSSACVCLPPFKVTLANRFCKLSFHAKVCCEPKKSLYCLGLDSIYTKVNDELAIYEVWKVWGWEVIN